MITLDTSGLQSALRFVEATSKRPMADSLNRAALHAIIGSGTGAGAMQLTPKANKSSIKGVTDAMIRGLIVKRLRAKNKLKRVTSQQLDEWVAVEKARRIRAAGYTAFIGWTPAAKALGGTGARGKGKTKEDPEQFNKSEAIYGRATKASPENLFAEIVNTAPMAEEIGGNALQKAIDNAADDLIVYGQRKFEEQAKKGGF
jgi:hypothetical protein